MGLHKLLVCGELGDRRDHAILRGDFKPDRSVILDQDGLYEVSTGNLQVVHDFRCSTAKAGEKTISSQGISGDLNLQKDEVLVAQWSGSLFMFAKTSRGDAGSVRVLDDQGERTYLKTELSSRSPRLWCQGIDVGVLKYDVTPPHEYFTSLLVDNGIVCIKTANTPYVDVVSPETMRRYQIGTSITEEHKPIRSNWVQLPQEALVWRLGREPKKDDLAALVKTEPHARISYLRLRDLSLSYR